MSEQYGSTETQAWKALITQLPSVLGAEFRLENQTIREVHILSDQSRQPKQIARDVQSAMLTKFGVDLDHRTISVAQIPGTALRLTPKRLYCQRLELSTNREGATACIYLTLGEQEFVGRADCDFSEVGRWRAFAQATVAALNQLVAPNCTFSLEEIRRTALGKHWSILVGLTLKLDGMVESLLGACYEGEDPNFSVALATLDAVNRRLSILPSPRASADGPGV